MAQDETTTLVTDMSGWKHTSIVQKIGVFSGFVAMLTLGALIIVWSWAPAYKILYSSLADHEVITVLNALYSNGFDAKLDESSGAILVPAKDIHIARIKLTHLGLPDSRPSYPTLEEGMYNREFSRLNENGSALNHVEYTHRVEEILSRRIERFLEPLVGAGFVRAQVTIHTNTDEFQSGENSNEEVSEQAGYLSTLIGEMNKLFITVIVDDKREMGVGGELIRISRTPGELEKLRLLVEKAVGFNFERGDSIEIINSSFTAHPVMGPVSESGKLKNIWYQDWLRKGIGVILVTLLVFAAFWYVFRTIFGISSIDRSGADGIEPDNQQAITPSDIAKKNFDENMRTASILVKNDPKLVAQILKNWVSADGG